MPDKGFEVAAGSPFAVAFAAARAASERGDVSAMDTRYGEAVRLADGLSASHPALRGAVAVEHVSRLREHGDSTTALARCEKYLAEYGQDVRLLLQRAETKLTRGDFSGIDDELAGIRRIAVGQALSRSDRALLRRLERIVAAPARPVSSPQGSPQARLARAEELRQAGRYEDALAELELAFAGPVDPALRFFFLEARVRLLRLLHADEEADALMPEVYEAAGKSAQPEKNRAAARRLETTGAAEPAAGGHLLQYARRLIVSGRLAEAEQLLLAAHDPTADERHQAEWHLATAELMMAVTRRTGARTVDEDGARQAAELAAVHSQECIDHAIDDSLVVLRISALRLLGYANAKLDRLDHAVQAWARAHRTEEAVATLQPPDSHRRMRMLRAVPTEFDALLGWARDQAAPPDATRTDLHAALVVVAMESARGAAILPHILPHRQPRTRDLPEPGDVAAARRWIRRAIRGLPRSQLIWMLHATQDKVFHAFVERTVRGPRIRVEAVSVMRTELLEEIDKLVNCWTKGGAQQLLRDKASAAKFDDQLRTVASLLGISKLEGLPQHIRRIAVVAGGELSQIPFALLPCPGTTDVLIGRRHALSDLPCLAARAPLHRRSRRQRGTRAARMLLLRGPDRPGAPITPTSNVKRREIKTGTDATPAELSAALSTGRYRQVRIDSHGKFGDHPTASVLELFPPHAEEGLLRPDRLRATDLSATGTLVLGACETGMFTRIGRDENDGFVRAGLTAGASAVLAARWEAVDETAVDVLDRFERNLRRHPRDVALFLAQRAADTGDVHPSRWAAWAIYGATNFQTRAPLLRRLLP